MSKAMPKTRRMPPNDQLDRFKAMAAEVGADESPDALDRSFRRINPKIAKPIRRVKKPK